MGDGEAKVPGGDVESLTFEEAFRQLTETAAQLEAGGLTLDQVTSQFELGMKLVQRCNSLLDNAELEITRLKESYQRDGMSSGPQAGFPANLEEDDLPF